MPDFLVFQLYGALASWGDIAVGEDRPSLGHPTKSAIMGLLAAALGIERENDTAHTQLAQQYAIAVCVRANGELMRDYHTVQVPGGKHQYACRRDELLMDKLNLNAILSKRDYRTDAFYQVAVWATVGEPAYPLASLQQYLQRPVFNLYLGRKSCPVSLPLNPVISSVVSLKQAFDAYPLAQASPWTDSLTESELVSYYWEEGKLTAVERGMESSMTYPRRDQVSSRQRWQFANRDEFYYAELVKGVSSCILVD